MIFNGLASSEDELRQQFQHLEDTSQSYGILINASKMKVMSNTTDGFIDKITINIRPLRKLSHSDTSGHYSQARV